MIQLFLKIVCFSMILSFNIKAENLGKYVGFEMGSTKNSASIIQISFGGPEADYVSDSVKTLVLGYGYEVVHVEAILSLLGDTGFTFGNYLEYERDAKFIGAAVRWKWNWFSVRIGFGTVLTKATATDTTTGSATITHQLEVGSNKYAAALFGFGLNIPVNKKFDLFIESNGISWSQDDKELEYNNGVGSSGTYPLEDAQSYGVVALGFRYYLN